LIQVIKSNSESYSIKCRYFKRHIINKSLQSSL